ncbi:MAG: undecaprenyl/decaprenyl-phosphate alpha-N-acetylglucosaminyl 1-phosphate transferase [Chloroflexi bacterium]|nr:undecaprenyl/decaprenyl-phosphate alpha-N-acetylglucosaminyl 1-phosphate transferase [Chloroflexota bacterium]MCI0645211.1 undecaprenyl/decaprenyl-phosphate alpha-N-acetylglucosaminyl 1-phosphate transferase [Chloroflexota bacterium]MCI0725283.1 undecaprenyl/decaprenyl-phosphate alpha-N-acetylglucosaminyl 1-phosphate transferase [Chloroflexota bacterium]
MRIFIFIFLIALAVTAFSTPLIRRFSIWIGFVDVPATRKLHREPMPLMGGVAIFAGAILAALLLLSTLPAALRAPEVWGVLLASAVVALVGLIDDRRHLPAWMKLAGQLAGFLIVAYFGVRVRLPFPDAVDYLITFLWLAGISNAINFLDNMDGLSAGVSGVAAAFILLLAAFNDQHLVAALAAGVLGACLGFLRYNFHPARIFMGDAGALFLGFLLAVLGIQLRFPGNVNFVTWMVPVFILGLPIFDTTLVIISRLRRRVNPFTTAGKDHVSHRLATMGFSHREVVLLLYLVAGTFGMVGLFITQADPLEGYTIGATTALLLLYAIWRLERRRERAAAAGEQL